MSRVERYIAVFIAIIDYGLLYLKQKLPLSCRLHKNINFSLIVFNKFTTITFHVSIDSFKVVVLVL